MSFDVRLIHGDCVAVMRELDAESIDLILTSPPYDNLRKYASGSSFDFEALALECKRVLKPGGVLVWVVGDQTVDGSETGTSFRQALHFASLGLRLRDTMIWRKANPFHTGDRSHYQNEFEFMFVLTRGCPRVAHVLREPCRAKGRLAGDTHREHGKPLARLDGYRREIGETKRRGNVWTYAVGMNPHMTRTDHPAVFPLQLAVDHVLSWTDEGDTVLDPFMGSGTTGEACLKTGRKFVGIEISPEYLAIAEKRIKSEMDKHLLFAG